MSSDDEETEELELTADEDDTILWNGIEHGDAAAVQQAIRIGADVYGVRDFMSYDATPLTKACADGHDRIVRILLDADVDTRWRDCHGFSAIEHACMHGHLSIVEMLLDHDKALVEHANRNGRTPLFLAIDYMYFDIVRLLLERGANAHATTRDGTTTLMHACSGNTSNLESVRLMLAAGVKTEIRDESQHTALHRAARNHFFEAARELMVEHNANIFAVNKNGQTPFDLLIQFQVQDHHAVDQFLETYCNKMTQDHGRSTLHAILDAAEYTYLESEAFHPPLKPLLRIRLPLGKLALNYFRTMLSTLDTDLIRNRDENGKLPIHLACRTNAPVEVLSMLVEIDPATLHIADHAGALPLHECCCGVVDDLSVRFLVEQGGVGTLAARTREGALPLHVLSGSTNPSWRTVQYMIRYFPGSVAARTNAGYYPFVIAACESSTASLSVVYELVRANPDLVIPK